MHKAMGRAYGPPAPSLLGVLNLVTIRRAGVGSLSAWARDRTDSATPWASAAVTLWRPGEFLRPDDTMRAEAGADGRRACTSLASACHPASMSEASAVVDHHKWKGWKMADLTETGFSPPQAAGVQPRR
jgi:hypothetical protein